jgi:hypothetical protein
VVEKYSVPSTTPAVSMTAATCRSLCVSMPPMTVRLVAAMLFMSLLGL